MIKIEIELPDDVYQSMLNHGVDPGPICSEAIVIVVETALEIRAILKKTSRSCLSLRQIQRRITYRKRLTPVPGEETIWASLQHLKKVGKAAEERVKRGTKTYIHWRRTNAAERLAGAHLS